MKLEKRYLDMTMTVELITPAMARKYLDQMLDDQRNIRPMVVECLAGDMRNSAYTFSHQGIAFDTDGYGIDGQHRLSAIIKSGESVAMAVFRNVPKEAYANLDRTAVRRVGDAVHMSNTQVSAVSWLNVLQLGAREHLKDTVDSVRRTYENNKPELDAVFGFECRSIITGSTLAALAYALPVNRGKVLDFANGLKTGADLAYGHPALSLRNNITSTPTMRARTRADYTLVAIRAAIDGSRLTKIYPHTARSSYIELTARRERLGISNTPSSKELRAKYDAERAAKTETADEPE